MEDLQLKLKLRHY